MRSKVHPPQPGTKKPKPPVRPRPPKGPKK